MHLEQKEDGLYTTGLEKWIYLQRTPHVNTETFCSKTSSGTKNGTEHGAALSHTQHYHSCSCWWKAGLRSLLIKAFSSTEVKFYCSGRAPGGKQQGAGGTVHSPEPFVPSSVALLPQVSLLHPIVLLGAGGVPFSSQGGCGLEGGGSRRWFGSRGIKEVVWKQEDEGVGLKRMKEVVLLLLSRASIEPRGDR